MNYSNEVEINILGSVLIDNNLMAEAIGQGVAKDMFFSIPNQELWSVFSRLQHNGMVIDPTTIVSEYKGNVKKIGGIEYLSKLSTSIATLSGFKDHLKILLKRYQQRKISELRYFIQKNENREPDEVISEIQAMTIDILKISAHENHDKETRYFDHIENKYKIKSGQVQAGYSSGFKYIDESIGGFRKGNLISIVSGSGVGKTTFAINMAYSMAKAGIKTAFYSVEMTESELLDKITSAELEIDYKRISTAQLSNQELKNIEIFTNGLLEIPLDIVQDITTTEELMNDIMYRSLSRSVEVIFIDYLQLFCESSKGNNLSEKLGDLTINLKKSAQKSNLTIIALGQTNRSANSRIKDDDPESFLLSEQDIQDSARIAQNSNIVLGIARNTFLDDADKRKKLMESKLLDYNSMNITLNPELMLVQIIKNRSGLIGKIGLRYKGKFSKVENFR